MLRTAAQGALPPELVAAMVSAVLDRQDVRVARLLAEEPGAALANRRAIELATLLLEGGSRAARADEG